MRYGLLVGVLALGLYGCAASGPSASSFKVSDIDKDGKVVRTYYQDVTNDIRFPGTFDVTVVAATGQLSWTFDVQNLENTQRFYLVKASFVSDQSQEVEATMEFSLKPQETKRFEQVDPRIPGLIKPFGILNKGWYGAAYSSKRTSEMPLDVKYQVKPHPIKKAVRDLAPVTVELFKNLEATIADGGVAWKFTIDNTGLPKATYTIDVLLTLGTETKTEQVKKTVGANQKLEVTGKTKTTAVVKAAQLSAQVVDTKIL